jgi:hypothetical protein
MALVELCLGNKKENKVELLEISWISWKERTTDHFKIRLENFRKRYLHMLHLLVHHEKFFGFNTHLEQSRYLNKKMIDFQFWIVCVFCVCAGDKFSTAGVEVENMVDIIFEHTDGIVYNHVSNSVIFESSNDYVRTHLAPIFDTHYVSHVDNGVVISFHLLISFVTYISSFNLATLLHIFLTCTTWLAMNMTDIHPPARLLRFSVKAEKINAPHFHLFFF